MMNIFSNLLFFSIMALVASVFCDLFPIGVRRFVAELLRSQSRKLGLLLMSGCIPGLVLMLVVLYMRSWDANAWLLYATLGFTIGLAVGLYLRRTSSSVIQLESNNALR